MLSVSQDADTDYLVVKHSINKLTQTALKPTKRDTPGTRPYKYTLICYTVAIQIT